jgi:hypothetical protein
MCVTGVAGAVLAIPSAAVADGGTVCRVSNPVALNPGLTLQGSSGTFESDPLGTVTCNGPVRGITPTGTGSFHDKGKYGTDDPDDCIKGGEGTGSYTLIFPTKDGDKTVALPFTLKYGAPSDNGGLVGIHTKGDGWVGEFGANPTKGDCVSAPVTGVLATGTITFSGGSY